ncbi:MAG: hypothetical protein EON52_18785 [Actinomycetales bacterium]|nr:MAG: hypothetical protein EON52_18785 [Actinomycetales bacterium]
MMDRLEARARELVGDSATVTREDPGSDVPWTLLLLRVSPANPGARSFDVVQLGDELVVQIGEVGGRWGLTVDADGTEFALLLLDACIAGRVHERFAPGRSAVTVWLANGETFTETGYEFPHFYPIPGWRHLGRRVAYEPYVDAESV